MSVLPGQLDITVEEDPRTTLGYRYHTHARSTGGGLVVLVDGYEQGLCTPEESVRNESGDRGDGRWFLICDRHGALLSDDVQAKLRPFMSAPEQWCSACSEELRSARSGE